MKLLMGRLRACGDCGKSYPLLFGHYRQCAQRRVEFGILIGVMLLAAISLVVAMGTTLSFTDDVLVPAVAGLVGCAIGVVAVRVFKRKSAA